MARYFVFKMSLFALFECWKCRGERKMDKKKFNYHNGNVGIFDKQILWLFLEHGLSTRGFQSENKAHLSESCKLTVGVWHSEISITLTAALWSVTASNVSVWQSTVDQEDEKKNSI